MTAPGTPTHIPVLMAEVLGVLAPRAGQTYVDCTAGQGGHAVAIASQLGKSGRVVLFDLDPGSLEQAAARVRAIHDAPEVLAHHASFAEVARVLGNLGVRADLVLADLGFASTQMDNASRGLSFMRDGPLDMRLNPHAPITAAELVNTLPGPELADLLREFGEEAAARTIAQKIVQSREHSPITTTVQLASIIRSVIPRRPGAGGSSIDPATKTFQALRIAVNDELGSLDRLLDAVRRASRSIGLTTASGASGSSWLSPEARIGIISFHSLEDRRVKQAFAGMVEQGFARLISKGAVSPGDGEIASNPRSRSAKLRGLALNAPEGSTSGAAG